jgi:hypothetical protein
MKVNREVSDLARKLDYIGVDSVKRREIIKECVSPLRIIFGESISIKRINNSYNIIKREMEKLEEQRTYYEKLNKENDEIIRINYIALQN